MAQEKLEQKQCKSELEKDTKDFLKQARVMKSKSNPREYFMKTKNYLNKLIVNANLIKNKDWTNKANLMKVKQLCERANKGRKCEKVPGQVAFRVTCPPYNIMEKSLFSYRCSPSSPYKPPKTNLLSYMSMQISRFTFFPGFEILKRKDKRIFKIQMKFKKGDPITGRLKSMKVFTIGAKSLRSTKAFISENDGSRMTLREEYRDYLWHTPYTWRPQSFK